jgi:hypothetical protein
MMASEKEDKENLKVKQAKLNVEIHDIKQEATVQSHISQRVRTRMGRLSPWWYILIHQLLLRRRKISRFQILRCRHALVLSKLSQNRRHFRLYRELEHPRRST